MITSVITTTTDQRQRAAASALGSVRAEGLEPSQATLERIKRYASGEITATQLTEQTLVEVRELATRTSN